MPTPKLFEPIKINGLLLENRIVVPPMCTWLNDPEDNVASDATFVHYSSLALGGSGLVIFEASPVEYRGRLQPQDMGIYDDKHVMALKRINDFIHTNTKAKTAIQIGHGGRKGPLANCFDPVPKHLSPEDPYGSQAISSTSEPFNEHFLTPKQMTRADMDEVRDAFVAGARRAVQAGFDAIEVHGAHGYLLCQFSSATNNRSDEYGGSLENRLKFPLEVIGAVRKAMPSTMPLIVRISASDWVEGGTTIEESVEYSKRMKAIGVDVVHVSSGGQCSKQNIVVGWNYQIPFAEKILKEADILTIGVGGITKGDQANEILETGQASLVAVGRAMLKDPYWPRNTASEMGVDVFIPPYQRAAYFSARKKAAEELKRAQQTK